MRTQGSAHSAESSRHVWSETYKDEEDSEGTCIEDIADLAPERLNQAS